MPLALSWSERRRARSATGVSSSDDVESSINLMFRTTSGGTNVDLSPDRLISTWVWGELVVDVIVVVGKMTTGETIWRLSTTVVGDEASVVEDCDCNWQKFWDPKWRQAQTVQYQLITNTAVAMVLKVKWSWLHTPPVYDRQERGLQISSAKITWRSSHYTLRRLPSSTYMSQRMKSATRK